MLNTRTLWGSSTEGCRRKPALIGNENLGGAINFRVVLLHTLQNWVLNDGYSELMPRLKVRAIFNQAALRPIPCLSPVLTLLTGIGRIGTGKFLLDATGRIRPKCPRDRLWTKTDQVLGQVLEIL